MPRSNTRKATTASGKLHQKFKRSLRTYSHFWSWQLMALDAVYIVYLTSVLSLRKVPQQTKGFFDICAPFMQGSHQTYPFICGQHYSITNAELPCILRIICNFDITVLTCLTQRHAGRQTPPQRSFSSTSASANVHQCPLISDGLFHSLSSLVCTCVLSCVVSKMSCVGLPLILRNHLQ